MSRTSQLPAADQHDFIEVTGARVNNLRNISVRIPKRRLTVFTGVSGSGKSSLVFGTIAAESQRLINETYSAFVQGFMPSLARPEVDALSGLTTAILVDQERMGANPRSTVGTVTDANAMLRLLYSRIGTPHIGSANAFSFNVPTLHGSGVIKADKPGAKAEKKTYHLAGGMCGTCEGRGQVSDLDLDQLFDSSKSLLEGAITIPGYTADGWAVRIIVNSGIIDGTKPICEYTDAERQDFLYAQPRKIKLEGINMTYEGLVPKVRKSLLSKDRDAMQPHIRAFVDRAVAFTACPDCDGTRLNAAARAVTINGLNIAQACAMQISDLAQWLSTIENAEVAPLIASLQHTLDSFVAIGLGYLSLDRSSGSLSGGEAQRTKMVRHLGSALTDVTYVFDEPTAGLHPHDINQLNGLLLALRDKGNTVLVVEHKPETIAIADFVVDLGPGAGSAGGEVCFTGEVAELQQADTPTGRHLKDRHLLKPLVRSWSKSLPVRNAQVNNLQSVAVDIPLNVLTVVTGVAGSGKSSLIHHCLPREADIIYVDQSPIRGSRRSNPATYTGMLEPIRKAFARANGVKPALFSANSEGACPACNGNGVIYTDLGMMAGVSTVCEECEGKRFQAQVLEYCLGEANISEVLGMSVDQAQAFFNTAATRVPAAAKMLGNLHDVGLGYLRIGQPLTTLSGGERQRLKLATEMSHPGGIYVLDEPTTGLHLADVQQLLHLLDQLVSDGKTVIVIEHNLAVMSQADWLIDLGPGAGHDGGTIVFTGTPQHMVDTSDTLTAQHLRTYVSGADS